MIWLVLLTFCGGTAHIETKQIKCPTYQCVEDVMAHTRESRTLTRLRVFFPGNAAWIMPMDLTAFPADTDWLFI